MRRRWLMLFLGWFAQVASCGFLYGIPSLTPALRQQEGFALSGAGVVAAAPVVGLTVALIGMTGYGWGFVFAALFPLLAILATPVAQEPRRPAPGTTPVSGRSGTG